MTYTITLLPSRIEFLLKEGLQPKIISETESGCYLCELNIENNMDLLKVFHAGIHAGNDEVKKYLNL